MSAEWSEFWIQITAGKGPAECAWAAVRVMERLREEAAAAGIAIKPLELVAGPEPGTAQSILLAAEGETGTMQAFAGTWRGTVQWIERSPYRPKHKRKNWFVGVEVLAPVAGMTFDARDVRWETMRASGPGGQHVNRTESAVRVTHLPTGMQAAAAEERSQHRNRKLALARLARKLEDLAGKREAEAREKRWRAHQELVRGNPVRVFYAE